MISLYTVAVTSNRVIKMVVSGAVSILLLVALNMLAVQNAYAAERLYVYPNGKQSERRIAEDRYECHRWAVRETGFDPLNHRVPASTAPIRVAVAENPAKGAAVKGTVAGAVVGAIIGAIDDNHVGEGAAIGAVVGSIAGGAVENKGYQKEKARARDEAYRQADQLAAAQQRLEYDRNNYRRAIASCLESKNYTVR